MKRIECAKSRLDDSVSIFKSAFLSNDFLKMQEVMLLIENSASMLGFLLEQNHHHEYTDIEIESVKSGHFESVARAYGKRTGFKFEKCIKILESQSGLSYKAMENRHNRLRSNPTAPLVFGASRRCRG
jgi:hypothetical protein